jgi:hypothetical protein
MLDACIDAPADFEVWRRLARAALRAELPPERVAWRDAGSSPDLQVSGVLRGENLAPSACRLGSSIWRAK